MFNMQAAWLLFVLSTTIWMPVVEGRLPKLESSMLKEDISSQVKCKEYERDPTYNCAWAAGLNYFADQLIDGGKIVAYKILWKSRRWSDWFVPGINDIDKGYNPSDKPCDALEYRANSMRRMWAYFYHHKHVYIICMPEE